MPDNFYSEREKLVVDLYKNQNKSIRDIAKIAKMSFRDIGFILKKEGLSHGLAMTGDEDNKKSHSNNEKAAHAYKLFSQGKKPVQVAIELNLREKQVDKLYREFWKLKNLNELYEIYPQIEHSLPSFLKLHKALKKRGLNPSNAEWFADAIETGAIKIPEIQKQYANIIEELEAIDYKKTMAKYELQNITNQIAILNREIYKKRSEIVSLQIGAQELEGYLHGLENHNQKQVQDVQNE